MPAFQLLCNRTVVLIRNMETFDIYELVSCAILLVSAKGSAPQHFAEPHDPFWETGLDLDVKCCFNDVS